MPHPISKDELLALAGTELEPTSWFLVDQERVNLFADATDDHQFIHVDPERAAATPFGGTIAHGLLSLSLLPVLFGEVSPTPEGLVMALNYGYDKVRFVDPVRVGSEVRLHSKVTAVQEKKPGHILLHTEITMEIRGGKKPALVAESLIMYVVG
jgi:acyl dehydratase